MASANAVSRVWELVVNGFTKAWHLAAAIGVLGVLVFLLAGADLNRFKSLLEGLGLLAVLWFFLYKVAAGWLIPNLRLCIETERKPSGQGDGMDYLVVKLKLDKGPTDGLALRSIQVQVTPLPGAPEHLIDIQGIRRLRVADSCKVEWDSSADELPLHLAAGDMMEFSELVKVRSGIPYALQAVVVGTRAWIRVTSYLSQWRCCSVSLPHTQSSAAA